MTRAIRLPIRIVATVATFLVAVGTAIAQEDTSLPPPPPETDPLPSPVQPPPLLPQQEKAVQHMIETEINSNQDIRNHIQQEVDRLFGWTISLMNLLIAVIIAIPITIGLAALYLRRSAIEQLVREVRSQLELEKEHLRVQIAAELAHQLERFKQDVETAKAASLSQLTATFLAAQSEKHQILAELDAILAAHSTADPLPPEVQPQLQELVERLDRLKVGDSPLPLTADDRLKQGDALALSGRFEEAIQHYETGLALQPQVGLYLGMANALKQLHRYEPALEAIEQALQLQENLPAAWLLKGQILADLQKYNEAITAYDRAVQLNSHEQQRVWPHQAYVYIRLNQYAEALACLDQALALNPDDGYLYYLKADYYASQQQVDPALQHLQQAIQLQPSLRERAQTDAAFDPIRSDSRFQEL